MKKAIRSFGYAREGLVICIWRERNFRIQLICACMAIAAGIWLRLPTIEWCILLFCIALVLSLEMINTAIEHLCNIIQKEYDDRIRIIKDISAGAVLISALIAFVCGAIIFIPKIISIISLIKNK